MLTIEIEGYDCFNCGCDALLLHTEADQSDVLAGSWEFMAYDGDLVECPDCGFHHYVSCDSENPVELSWDETSEHNAALEVAR